MKITPTRRIGRAIRHYGSSEKGVTALEFGLVGGPFIWLLCAIFETGIMLFAEYIIENGTDQAGRLIRTGQVQTQGISQAQFKSLVCGNMTDFLNCNSKLYVDVRRFTDFTSISLPSAISGGQLSQAVTANGQFQTGAPLDVVVVRVFYDWKLFTPGVTLLANLANGRRVLSGAAAFRNEPYAVN